MEQLEKWKEENKIKLQTAKKEEKEETSGQWTADSSVHQTTKSNQSKPSFGGKKARLGSQFNSSSQKSNWNVAQNSGKCGTVWLLSKWQWQWQPQRESENENNKSIKFVKSESLSEAELQL